MKKTFLSLSILVLISSCGSESSNPGPLIPKVEPEESTELEEATNDTENEVEIPDETTEYSGDASIMLGTWKGEMAGKNITIVIDDVTGTTVSGYNIVGNNRRTIRGTYEGGVWDQPCAKAFSASLAEPGDDKWDGVFQIKFVGYEDMGESAEGGLECLGGLEGAEAFGEWKSNNGKLNHSFDLIKK